MPYIKPLTSGHLCRHPRIRHRTTFRKSTKMSRILGSLALATWAVSAIASPVAQPAITEAPSLAKRASSCTFSGSSGAASASKSQKSCSTIVLSDVAVPSGTTLDLSDLEDDTTVRMILPYTLNTQF
jgi:hypothetical protein